MWMDMDSSALHWGDRSPHVRDVLEGTEAVMFACVCLRGCSGRRRRAVAPVVGFCRSEGSGAAIVTGDAATVPVAAAATDTAAAAAIGHATRRDWDG